MYHRDFKKLWTIFSLFWCIPQNRIVSVVLPHMEVPGFVPRHYTIHVAVHKDAATTIPTYRNEIIYLLIQIPFAFRIHNHFLLPQSWNF